MPRRWLLKVTFAGIDYRWSDAAVSPVDDAGVEHTHPGGLPDLRLPSDYDPLRSAPNMRSVSIEVGWPKLDPLHKAIAEGHRFTDAVAELSIWTVGDSYDDRDIVIAGNPSEPQYGDVDETVKFTIKAQPWIDNAMTHRPSWVASQRQLGGFFNEGVYSNLPYPIVFGQPGKIPRGFGSAEQYIESSPAYLMSSRASTSSGFSYSAKALLICGVPVAAKRVKIRSLAVGVERVGFNLVPVGGETREHNVLYTTDRDRNTVAYVDLDALGYPDDIYNAVVEDSKWVVTWSEGAGVAGARGAIRQAGDLMEWMLQRLESDVDWQHFESIRPWMNRYEIAGVLLESTNCWKFIEDVIMKIVPMSATVSPRGIRFIPFRWDATAKLAKAHITIRDGLTTPGPITYDRVNSAATDYKMRFTPNLENEFVQDLHLVDSPAVGQKQITSGAIQELASQAALPSTVEVESAWVADPLTAGRVLRGMAEMARSSRTEVVHATGDDFADLEDGDVVLLTNAARSIEGQVCIVHIEHLSPDLRALHLRLLPGAG